jgi:hypothetical protein
MAAKKEGIAWRRDPMGSPSRVDDKTETRETCSSLWTIMQPRRAPSGLPPLLLCLSGWDLEATSAAVASATCCREMVLRVDARRVQRKLDDGVCRLNIPGRDKAMYIHF